MSFQRVTPEHTEEGPDSHDEMFSHMIPDDLDSIPAGCWGGSIGLTQKAIECGVIERR